MGNGGDGGPADGLVVGEIGEDEENEAVAAAGGAVSENPVQDGDAQGISPWKNRIIVLFLL